MRLSAAIVSSWSLLSSLIAATPNTSAQVFLIDSDAPSRPTNQQRSIDPITAQLIFAQRLGLSSFYDLTSASGEALKEINIFGGKPRQLLRGNSHAEEPTRVLVVVDNVEIVSDVIPSSSNLDSFTLNPAPHPSQVEELLSTFEYAIQEAGSLSTYTDTPHVLRQLSELSPQNHLFTQDKHHIVRVKSLRGLERSAPEYKKQIQTLKETFDRLVVLTSNDAIASVTIILSPPEHHCAKRSVKSFNLSPRTPKYIRNPAEAPLSGSVSHDPSPSVDDSEGTGTLYSPAAATSLLRGPIPACFSSKSACEEYTGNCTGHGECVVKRKTGSDNKNDCYGCTCNKPDVRKNKDGTKKTTHFSGGACHKKDVSTPFWLLGGTTIFLLFVISWGVGLLYSMGNEELPSVIGAGVSGPRATK